MKLTYKFPTMKNVSLIVLKSYLLEFNWCRAITQCTHPVNVLTTKLGIKIVCKRIPTQRSVAFLQLWPNGWMDQDATRKEVGLGPGHIVLDGDPAHPLNFRPMFIIAIVISLEHCTGIIGLFKFKF